MVDYDAVANDMASESGRPASPPPSSSNKYDAIADDMASDQTQSLKQSIYVGSQQPPDKQAKIQNLARQANLPPSVVDGNEEQVRQKVTQNSVDYDKMVQDNPKSTSFLQDPNNAGVAHDDIPNVQAHENLINSMHTASSIYDAFSAGLENSVSGLLYRRAQPDLSLPADAPWYHRAAQMAGQVAGDIPFMTEGSVLGGATGGAVAGPVGAAVGGAASAWGFPAALRTAINEHLQKGDVQGFSDLLQRTLDASKEFAKQGLLGLVTEGAGAVAGRLATGLGAAAPVVQTAAKGAEAVTMTAAGNAIEGKDTTAQDYLDNLLFVGGMHVAHLAADQITGANSANIDLKRAEQNKEFVDNLGQVVEQSKLRARSPETHAEMVGEFAAGTPAENVYLPIEAAQKYFQSKKIDPETAMNELGVSDSYKEAVQTGGDVKIPLSTYVSKLSGTEHYDGLSNDIKFSPDQPSVNEAKAEADQVTSQLKAADEAAKANGSQPKDSSGLVGENVAQQLMDAGYDRKTADTYAQIYESTFKSLGERAGVDPHELYNQYNLKIRSLDSVDDLASEEQAYQQGPVRNPEVEAAFTAPDAETNYAKLPASDNGRVISADTARELYAPYAKDRDGAVLHTSTTDEPAGRFASELVRKRIGEIEGPVVHAMAGGAGSGKTSYLQKYSKALRDSDIIFDSTSAHYGKTKELIEHSLKENKHFLLTFIYRPFEKALEGNKERFKDTGRLVPPHYMAYSHIAALDTFIKLREEYKNDPHVSFEAFDNSGKEPVQMPVEKLEALRYTGENATANAATKRLKKIADKGLENETEEVSKTKERARADQSSEAGSSGRPESESGGKGVSDQNASPDDQGSENSGKQSDEVKKLFQSDDDTGARGQITIGDHKTTIDLLKHADLSTFLHETGHFYMEVLGDLSARENAPQQIKDDYGTILNWLGADSRESITPEMHEKWARGFESYLMDGKAPTTRLRQVFARLKVWLLHVYRQAANLHVQLSPHITAVMGRLLASDYEISHAQQEQHMEPLFGRVGAYKMSDNKAGKYFKAFDEAREHAESTVTKKLMDDYQRERETWFQEKRDEIKKNITDQVESQQIYKTIDTLQKGKLPDGTPLKLSKSALLEMWGDKGLEAIRDKSGPYMYSREGGVHPDVAAELLGYESGDQMLQAIANASDKKLLIENLTNQKMYESHPDSFIDGTLPQEAINAVHNDKRAEILRMELEHLAEHNMPVLKDVIRRTVARVPSDEVVRDQATKIIASKSVEELSPYNYQLAERKAAKMAGEALARGDITETFQNKQRELLNHELYRAATDAREDIDRSLEKFKKIARSDEDLSKTRDTDLVNAAKSILAEFGLGKSDRSADSYISKIKTYDPDTYSNISALVESATDNAGNYREISYDNFKAMSDAVNAIYDLSKSSKEIEIEGKKIQTYQAKNDLEARISYVLGDPGVKPGVEKQVTAIEKAGMKLMGALGSFTRAEHWIAAMDGEMKGEPKDGAFRKYIWNPVNEGITKYRLEKDTRVKELRQVFEGLKGKLTKEQHFSSELNYTFTKGEILGALLHTGNDSNFRKLLLGRADRNGRTWGEVREDGSINASRFNTFMDRMRREGVLTKEDYDFAQKTWDLFDNLKPGAQRAHKSMYGHYFNEITASPIETPWGEYRGGYVPAKIDMFTNEDQAIRLEREEFEKNNNSWQFPTTGRGFTKSRVENYAAPLNLDLNMLGNHIDSVLRFTHIEPRAKEVGRLVMDKDFRAQLSNLNSEAGKEVLMPWLQRSAQQKIVIPSKSGIGKLSDSAARFLRTSVAMQTLVLNPANTLHQLTGVFAAATKVDGKFLRNGLVNYVTDHKNTVNTIMEKSDYMRSLKATMNQDEREAIHKIIADPGPVESARDWVNKNAFFLQKAAHDITSSVVWSGAYEQATVRGAEEADAVREADSVISSTQHINNPENIANYEVGTEFAKLFTQFSGFYNQMANNNASNLTAIARELGLKKGAGRMFHSYTLGFAMMAVSAQAILDGMYGHKNDDQDDDGYLNYALHLFFGSQFKLATAMVPYVGPMINSTVDQLTGGKHSSDDIRFSPVVSALEAQVKTPGEVYHTITGDMDLNKKTVKDVLQLLGLASGLPIGALGRPAGYLMDVNQGKVEPTGPIDFARGVMMGAAGH